MWIFYGCVITFVVGFVTAGDDVTVMCGSCDGGGSELKGNVGGNLTIIYSINKPTFVFLKIYINGTKKINIIPNGKVNTLGNIDKRFSVPKKLTENGNTKSVIITLTKLRLTDNGLVFKYTYTDDDGNDFSRKNTLKVSAGPTFCKPPEKKYEVEEGNKLTIVFSLCGNPEPTVSAKYGSRVIPVATIIDTGRSANSTPTYKYNYNLVVDNIKRGQCGDNLEFKAVGFKTISFISDVTLLFTPDTLVDVSAKRDENNLLTVKWDKLVYGSCLVRYHVRHTNNGTQEATRTRLLKMEFPNAAGNNSIAVNVEVNGRQGAYSEPIFIAAKIKPTQPIPAVKPEDKGLRIEYIIAIVVVVALIIIIILVVCILKRRKGKTQKNSRHDVDMQPLSHGTQVEPENEYADVDNFVVKDKPQEEQMIYAELGPGGGRTGQKPIVEQSDYAQVKTEGVHYPNLQASSQYRPPVYGVATRNNPPISNDYDDVSFDHASSVVV